VGLDRSAYLTEVYAASVTTLPFFLHPEIPEGGAEIGDLYGINSEDPRIEAYRDRLAGMAEEVGLEFNLPQRLPRTLRPLAASEWVRSHKPEAFPAFHVGLFTAYWAKGLDIEQDETITAVATDAGLDGGAVLTAVNSDDVVNAVHDSTTAAQKIGVSGTPYFLIDRRLMIGGVQPREIFDRAVEKLAETSPDPAGHQAPL
jgi:predicted DsbA family dithiol-disulfide isomerase